jgi:hypothetical protein
VDFFQSPAPGDTHGIMAAVTGDFLTDYGAARDRFRSAAAALGWTLESHPVGGTGPGGEALTIDTALSPGGAPAMPVLVVSSGMHGVEGIFGSAVQARLLDLCRDRGTPDVRVVFIHAVNPYGFAWQRRTDADNVDVNRNFLLDDEPYSGAPASYAELDGLLNPRRPPSRWDGFHARALLAIARHGMPALRRAVATGQYDFPRGLFFGGSQPSAPHRILADRLPAWIADAPAVVHLDLHTGLGAHGALHLLVDFPVDDALAAAFTRWLGPDALSAANRSAAGYHARGGFGRWCVARRLAPTYVFAYAEFGTYGPLTVLDRLRQENQACHWAEPDAPCTIRARRRLVDVFCPPSPRWRAAALSRAVALVSSTAARLARR